MRKIEQNKEKKKRDIIASAKSLFLKQGYRLTSMDSIAADAKVTKQTLYRYYPSKISLFTATLQNIGENFDQEYLTLLEQENTKEALTGFATSFLRFHLSNEHIALQRLLIAEANHEPELIQQFMRTGSEDITIALSHFFIQRLSFAKPEKIIQLWLGMLLAPRTDALLGLARLTENEINDYAIDTIDFFLTEFNEIKQ